MNFRFDSLRAARLLVYGFFLSASLQQGMAQSAFVAGTKATCEFDGIESFSVRFETPETSGGSWKRLNAEAQPREGSAPITQTFQVKTGDGTEFEVGRKIEIEKGKIVLADSWEAASDLLPLALHTRVNFPSAALEGATFSPIVSGRPSTPEPVEAMLQKNILHVFSGVCDGFVITFPTGRKLSCTFDTARRVQVIRTGFEIRVMHKESGSPAVLTFAAE